MIADLKSYPAMKDSGMASLGQVPAHWDLLPIGRIGQLFKGRGGSKEDEVPSGIPCVRYGDLYMWHEFFITSTRSFVTEERAGAYAPIHHGDVLFAASGETIEEIGKSAVALLSGPAVCGGDVIVLRPAREIHPRFLGYAADSPSSREQKAGMGRGFTVVHIYASELKRLVMAVPSLDEQVAIVRFLDHADARIRRYIRAKHDLIKLLEEEKQAIVHGAVTRGLDPEVRLKPSAVDWLGDVPEHWEVTRLGRLVEVLSGFPFKSEGFTQDEADVRLLRGVNIAPGSLRWTDVVRWPECGCGSYSAFELRAGDIVLGMDRPIIQSGTRVATVSESDLPALLLQRVARIRPTDDLLGDFLTLLLAGKSFAEYLTPIFTGVGVPHLSPEQIKGFRCALPSPEEQREIVQWTGAATRKTNTAVSCAEREISLLHEYRARLISDVVTGKLDVREAAARLPDEIEAAGDDDFGEDGDEGTDDLDAVLEEVVA